MSDEVQERLERLTARGASPELRSRALDAVAAALAATLAAQATTDRAATAESPFASVQTRPRRRLPVGWLVAASLALAVALNVWLPRWQDRQIAALLGKPPVHRQAALIAAEVASVTDGQTGQWTYDRLTAVRRRHIWFGQYAARLETALRQFTLDAKETHYAAPPEIPQVDRHRSGRDDRRAVGVERLVRLDHRRAVGNADGRTA